MKITPLPAFSDNYIWVYEKDGEAMVIDPGEAQQVLDYIKEQKLQLKAILLTHKHEDHVGGVEAILETYPDTPVYGPSEVSDLADVLVQEGDTFEQFGQTIHVVKTAGHTEEHVSFIMDKLLFCGDALFSAGCGRVFTGDYQAQFNALQRFKELADDVQIFAGHEYTLTNLQFAQTVMPESTAVIDELERVRALNNKNIPSLPSTIGLEKEINPFLRAETLEEFIELRKARGSF